MKALIEEDHAHGFQIKERERRKSSSLSGNEQDRFTTDMTFEHRQNQDDHWSFLPAVSSFVANESKEISLSDKLGTKGGSCNRVHTSSGCVAAADERRYLIQEGWWY